MVHSLADVTITSTATVLSATSVKAAWVEIQASKANSGAIRVGDSSISSSQGGYIGTAAGSAYLFPPKGNANGYDLSTIYVIGTNNDTAAVLYDTF